MTARAVPSAGRAGLLVLALSAAAAAAPASRWHEAELPHFQVYYESALAPAGFSMSLERLHSRLALELSALAPWMSTEKIKIFVFSSRASYVSGPFEPPRWSNGLSEVDKKLVAVYERPDAQDLQRTVAHEMTHVLFETFFKDKGLQPPAWLTEGLAMLMETSQVLNEDDEKESPWNRALFGGGRLKVKPMREFFAQEPEDEKGRDAISDWYVQAYGVVRFLAREHSRLQFRLFCTKLRDTRDLERSLWDVYRYRSLEDFQKVWLAWVGRSAGPGPSEQRPARFELRGFK